MKTITPIQKRKPSKSYSALVWGFVLVLAAVVLILDDAGVPIGFKVSPWRIILGVALFAWLVYEIIRLRFTEVFFPIAFLFILFQKPLAEEIKYGKERFLSPWVVLLAALLLTIGCKILFRNRGEVIVNGHRIASGKSTGGGKVGDQTVYFDASDLSDVRIREHIGTVEVFISNPEAYNGEGEITISENLGIVKLHLPNEWNVVTYTKENLGKVSIPDHEATGDKSITLAITENLGEISVIFE